MITEINLNDDILKIILKIEDNFPELLKYFAEMPIIIPTNNYNEINAKNLKDYYDSLEVLYLKYSLTHSI